MAIGGRGVGDQAFERGVSLVTRINTGTQKRGNRLIFLFAVKPRIPVLSGLLAIQNISLHYFSVGKLLAT
jgi:hypothetical protein